jgi:hypothetical protein
MDRCRRLGRCTDGRLRGFARADPCRSTTVPRSLTRGFILSRTRCPFGAPRLSIRSGVSTNEPSSPPARSAFHGVLPLITTSDGSSHFPRGTTRDTQSPRYGASSAFLPPTTLSSAAGLAGLFHPAAVSRVHPSGVSTLRTEPHRVSPAVALGTFTIRHLRLPAPAPNGPPSGPCSPHGVRRSIENGEAPDRSAPLVGFASSGSSPSTPWQRLHATSARDLDPNEPARIDPRRFASAEIGSSGTRPPTRSRFAA